MNRFLCAALGACVLTAGLSAQNISTNWKHGSDRTKCEDLQITSSDYEIARGEQQLTLDAKNPVRVDGSRNGGVYLSGWDQPNYSVLACKVGLGETAAEAQQMLSSIKIGQMGGTLATDGPDNKHWMVSYIIRIPHNANISASSYNGPVSVRDGEGHVELTTHNGPVSVKHFTGDVKGRTQNGPVSYSGKSGNIELTTVNGPVSVDVESAQYSGEISANTNNGPVTLHLPSNNQTAFLVEGGTGPMSCQSAICSKAETVFERHNKRISFGTSPKIKASTQNGPVTVGGNDEL